MKSRLSIDGYTLMKSRVVQGFTMDDLSKKTGLSTKTICDTENGKSIPTPKTIKRICEALDIDPLRIIA